MSASSAVSLPDQLNAGVVQNIALSGLPEPTFTEVTQKLRTFKGQKPMLRQMQDAIKDTSWGEKPAEIVVSARADGTSDVLITFYETPSTATRVRIGGNVLAPNLIQQVKPVYPSEAKEIKLQGIVVLEVNIATDGTVSDARVITGHPLLVRPAVDAVRQWVYKPVMLNGQPVEVVSTVTV